MKLQQFAPLVSLAALAQAGERKQWGTAPVGTSGSDPSTVWITTVVPTFTTYCLSPTTWAYLNTTYTVTSETTITLPCPCTVSISSVSPLVTTSTYTTEVPCETSASPSFSIAHSPGNLTSIPPAQPSSSTIVTITVVASGPSASTFLSGITSLGGRPGSGSGSGSGGSPTTLFTTPAPARTPVAPTSIPGVVTINGAYKAGPGVGALGFVAGLAAMML